MHLRMYRSRQTNTAWDFVGFSQAYWTQSSQRGTVTAYQRFKELKSLSLPHALSAPT